MKIIKFDTQNGVYHFQLDELSSDLHAHPMVEIIYALEGDFSLETENTRQSALNFVLINTNIKHRVFSEKCEVQMLMLECNNILLSSFLKNYDLKEENGIFTVGDKLNEVQFFSEISTFVKENNLRKTEDERVEACLQLFQKENLEYKEMIQFLTAKVFLSESRLSHVFKENIGISLKKYLVWSRLKKVVDLMLKDNKSLLEAGNMVGFYDQAHLSKSFKSILGISPSKAYNSRNLQV